MRSARPCLCIAVTIVVMVAFASPGLAADICGESVPANRVIDGIPAYAQCAASMTGAIYSNDGVNTATTAADSTWVRTQRTGGYQCTELAHRYLHFRFNVTSVPNGDAGVWCDATLPAGLLKVTAPVHGDLIVLAPASCGVDATTGHVAVVDTIAADMTSVMAVQQNTAGRARYNMTCAACFLHATANTGASSPDAGAGDAGGLDGNSADRPGSGGAGSGGAGSGGSAGRDGGAGRSGSSGGSGGAGTSSGGAGTSSGGSGGTNGAAGATGLAGATGDAGTTGTGGAGGGEDGASGGCVVAGAVSSTVPSAVLLVALGGLLAIRRRRRK